MLRQAGIFSIGRYQQPSTPQLKRPREAPVIPQIAFLPNEIIPHLLPTHLDVTIFQASRQLSGHACKAYLLPWRLKTLGAAVFLRADPVVPVWKRSREVVTDPHGSEDEWDCDQLLNTAARLLASIPAAVTPTTDYQVNVVLINQKRPTLPFQKAETLDVRVHRPVSHI